MAKIRYSDDLESVKIGDQLYLKYNFGQTQIVKVTKVSKTLITDENGRRWRRDDGYPSGYRWSRATMAHWTAYKFIARVP